MGTEVLTKKSYTSTPEIEGKVEKLTEEERQRIEGALKEEIIYWIDEKENYAYAERIINETEKALSFIAENPYSCTPTDYENIRKVFVLNRYIIFFKINQEDIRILYFFNKDDNPKKIKLY